MNKKSGLTLIELVIVLAVFSILAAGVAMSFLNADRRELQDASLKLQADLRYAQRMAMIEGYEWGVMFQQNAYVIYKIGYREPQREVKKVYLDNEIEIYDYSVSKISYMPRGTVSQGFGVSLKNGHLYQWLTATVSGGRIAIGEILSE